MGKFTAKDYTLESQLRDMIKGYDVIADDNFVMKMDSNGHGKAFVDNPDDPKGHDHYEYIDGKWVKVER